MPSPRVTDCRRTAPVFYESDPVFYVSGGPKAEAPRAPTTTGFTMMNRPTLLRSKKAGGKSKSGLRIWSSRTPRASEPADPRDRDGYVGPVVEDSYVDVGIKYDVDPKQLGYGLYGVVRKCTDRETGESYAVKSILKSKVGKGNFPVLRREVTLLREMDHPNIIDLVDVYEDEENLHLVTELATGGELFDRIIAKREKGEVYSEKASAVIVRSILEAIAYCHDEKQVVHRDLKPENFLFKTEAEDSDIKLIDFGYARRHTPDHPPMKEVVGSTMYMAPELLERKYTRTCDIWSVGVIAFALLSGSPPFNAKKEEDIIELIKFGKFFFNSKHWNDVSVHGKDFICKMLKKDVRTRLTAATALQHRWIREFAPREGDEEFNEEDVTSVRRAKAEKSPRRRISAAQFAY